MQVVLVRLRAPIGRRYDREDGGGRGLEICGCLRVDDGGAENRSRKDSHERARLFHWHISSIELVNDFYRSEYFAHTSICNCHGDVNYWLGLPVRGGAKALLEDV